VVTVTVGDQTLTTRADSTGAWSVNVATLTDGPYTVVVRDRVTDADGNVTSTSQELTVCAGTPVVPPVTPPVVSPVAPPVAPPVAAPAATYRPDAEIRLSKRAYKGRGTYTVSRQRVTATLNGRPARTATFTVRVRNRGSAADRITIRGSAKSSRFTVKYLQGRKNVTAAVLKGTYRTGTLRPGGSATLTVEVTKVKGARKGSKRTFTIVSTSANDRTKKDSVAAVGRVTRS
jgi:hypothetical protein